MVGASIFFFIVVDYKVVIVDLLGITSKRLEVREVFSKSCLYLLTLHQTTFWLDDLICC